MCGERVADVFVVKRTLGAGRMGVVYLAHHEQWDLDVAVKAVHPEHVKKPEYYRQVLTQEAQAWTDLGPHPPRRVLLLRAAGQGGHAAGCRVS